MKWKNLFILALAATLSGQQNWSDGTAIRQPGNLVPAADWSIPVERRWPGPSIWCNRLQDWHVADGALVSEAPPGFPCRTAHLLTHELADTEQPFHLSVSVSTPSHQERAGFAGFLVGAGAGRLDYRGAALVHHFPGKGGGILAVVEPDGLTFRDMSAETNAADYPLISRQTSTVYPGESPVTLTLEGAPAGAGKFNLRLAAWNGEKLLAATELRDIDGSRLRGNVALASHNGGNGVSHRFAEFRVGGAKLTHHPERTFGPIAGTLYTVSNNTLKLSAQFLPLAERVSLPTRGSRLQARLEKRRSDGSWEMIDGPRAIAAPDFYVPFRVENWDSSRNAETRVVFEDIDGKRYDYKTRVTRDPVEKKTVSVAGFTGMGVMGRIASRAGPEPGEGEIVVGRWSPANMWMPFADAVRAVEKHDVDFLFFTGDQVYEGKPSPKDLSFEPKEDYLYKWLLWHWSFRDLTNHLPASVQPDDHDVYHGNLWGWGGRMNLTGHNAGGGYLCSPYFVNMVHRTMSGHLPDPHDPKPALNGISNYYTTFSWGGVGFAVLEDRKFKTPGHISNPAEQVQLGKGQQDMLREWAKDWRDQKLKCVVSQTIYAGMHVGFEGAISADRDTNGFPKVRRDEAVELFRRASAFVLSGDQHLSTFGRLGIEQPSDAVYQFAVPAIGNIFWRWFYPTEPGGNRDPGAPDYTGDFVDGHGNHFRMIAVANPERRSLLGQRLRQRYLIPAEEARGGLGDEIRTARGDGYGIVRFHKDTRKITVECWPHNVDPTAGGQPFAGWPVTLDYDDLDGRRPVAWLPDLDISGADDPVVEIISQRTGETVKAGRVNAGIYSPGVFDASADYTVRVGVPEASGQWWSSKDLRPSLRRGASRLAVAVK